jgi:two-component system, NarL family, invasion response regulator UvrY
MEGRLIRVFLADDHPIVLDGIARFLASTTRVDVVGTAADVQGLEEGLRATEVHVVVLDLDMPGMDGIGSFERLRGEFDGVRWVIFTMKREEREAAAYLRSGASAFLNKGRPPDELVAAIEMAHRGGRYLTDRVPLHDLSKAAPLPHTTFSDREQAVFRRLIEGAAPREIAEEMGIQRSTVHTYVDRIKVKLDAGSTTEIVSYAFRHGLVE